MKTIIGGLLLIFAATALATDMTRDDLVPFVDGVMKSSSRSNI